MNQSIVTLIGHTPTDVITRMEDYIRGSKEYLIVSHSIFYNTHAELWLCVMVVREVIIY